MPPRRAGDEADLDITPMIDVTFLLLIFFMVTSTMQQNQDLDVPTAKHGTGIESRETVTVSILRPASDAVSPTVRLSMANRAPVELPSAAAPGELDEAVRGRIIEEVSAARQLGQSLAIIKADRDVSYGFIDKVMKAVNDVEGMSFSFEVRDKR